LIQYRASDAGSQLAIFIKVALLRNLMIGLGMAAIVSLAACESYPARLSLVPFLNAICVDSCTLEEFKAAMMQEKKSFTQALNQKRSGVFPSPLPIQLRQFPTLAQWEKARAVLKLGDEVLEFKHRYHFRLDEGKPQQLRHVYWFLRNGNRVYEIEVTFGAMEKETDALAPGQQIL
jgi:hypothetical protein